MPGGRGVLVQHAMTKQVLVANANESLEEAATRLREHEISGLPVVDADGHVVGVLSEKDIARELTEANGADPASNVKEIHGSETRHPMPFWEMTTECLQSMKVRDAMTPEAITVSPTTSLDVAARIMLERGINRLPVVERGKLIGILTRHDVLAAMV